MAWGSGARLRGGRHTRAARHRDRPGWLVVQRADVAAAHSPCAAGDEPDGNGGQCGAEHGCAGAVGGGALFAEADSVTAPDLSE
ncbi:hypothetical protein GCM10027452_05670 [Micromonospora halotolerans]